MSAFTPRFMTVVYMINDPSKFLEENERLHAHFYPDPTGKPWAITAMSLDHEIRRLELIEEAMHEQLNLELLDTLLSHPRIGCVTNLEELGSEPSGNPDRLVVPAKPVSSNYKPSPHSTGVDHEINN